MSKTKQGALSLRTNISRSFPNHFQLHLTPIRHLADQDAYVNTKKSKQDIKSVEGCIAEAINFLNWIKASLKPDPVRTHS